MSQIQDRSSIQGDPALQNGPCAPMIPDDPLARTCDALSLFRFALPSMAMMLFMGAYTMVDTIFVARFVDTDALSAINIVCPVINIIVGIGTMLATGGSAIVAEKMGGGRLEEARGDFTRIVLTGALIGLGIMGLGLLTMDKIIWGLGASARLFPYCRAYLRIQLLFAAGNMMQVLYQNLFVTAGRPALGLVLSVLAGVMNLVFDYIFIVCLGLGIMGAALGTGLGYMLPTLVGTLFFLQKRSGLRFSRPGTDGRVLLKSFSNGVSEMVSQLSAAVTTFFFNRTMMDLLGEDGVAAITVIIYSQFLLTTLYIGFSMGVAPVISYHHGRGDRGQLKKICGSCFGLVLTISLLVALAAFFAGRDIVGLFAGEEAAVFQVAERGLRIFSFSFLFSGCNIFASAMFTALSDGKSSAAISFLRTFGALMVLLSTLPRFLQETGVWLSIPAAEGITLILTVWLMGRYGPSEVEKL